MNDEETRTAAAHIRRDWSEHRHPPGGGDTEAVPGGRPTVDARYAGQSSVPYWPRGESQPVVIDNQGWSRTRLLDASALGRSIAVSFEWPSDYPSPRTYLLVVDVAGWSPDDQLTSTAIWSQLAKLLATPDWTTKYCVALSQRLSVVTLPLSA